MQTFEPKPGTIVLDAKYAVDINMFHGNQALVIFNDRRYFELSSSSDNDLSFELVRLSDRLVCASVCFYESAPGQYESPKRATFGGMAASAELDADQIERFLSCVIAHLKKKGAQSIYIKCAPLGHNLRLGSLVVNLLMRHGFKMHVPELNFEMSVTDEPFEKRVDYGNAKRIRKCERQEWWAESVPASAYDKVYAIIRDNRLRRGFPISMSEQQIGQMLDLFPEKIHLFAVYKDSVRSAMAAAAICVALTDRILYVFYWGDAADVETHSPVALLAAHIYKFCREQGFDMLDVGTGTLSGVPNPGLMRFKSNLGFSESLKMSFEWTPDSHA
jgi:hypothetical protein